ncbi:hypothetical protein Lser_V15G45248 [Lactuca serriola]
MCQQYGQYLGFDHDEDYFATAGVSKKIKIIEIWDAGTGEAVSHHTEHEWKTWFVDFSRVHPMKLASGSDDYTAKLWSINEDLDHNFVGLSVADGYIACGLQTNESYSMDRKKQPLTSGIPKAIGVFSSNVRKPNSPQNEKINVDDFIDYGAFDGNNDNSLLPQTDKESKMWFL